MTLLFADGFDHYNTSSLMLRKWSGCGGSLAQIAGPSTSYARFSGSKGIRIYADNANPFVTIPDKTTVYLGGAIYMESTGVPVLYNDICMINFYDGYQRQIGITPNPNYGWNVYQGTSVNLLGASSDNVFQANIWYFIEVKVTISDTVGEVTIRMNETEILSLTNQDTKPDASYDYINRVSIAGSRGNRYWWWDDFYLDDAQFHGDVQIKTFYPDSVSSTNNAFTASAGNKDDCVDEDPPNDDTDYIYSNTLNHKQTFGITTGALATVEGIQVNNQCKLIEAGSRKSKALVRSGGANYQGSNEKYLNANYYNLRDTWDTDPDDSNPWTQTKLEAAEFGLEITV